MPKGKAVSLRIAAQPTEQQVLAAAIAWMAWQFPGRKWDDAIPEMQNKFLDGARQALVAAVISCDERLQVIPV